MKWDKTETWWWYPLQFTKNRWQLWISMHHIAHSNLCKAETTVDTKQNVQKSLMKGDLTYDFNSKK